MKINIYSLCFILLFSLSSKAQNTPSSSEIFQSLNKLNTIGSVLYIAAHPDDENTRLLSYMAKERKFKTTYLSLTRGDGGQNLIGSEQGEYLGLIRTEELLAARRNDGAEQWFTRAKDFGYSKNPEETFSFWNKDSVLADVVFAIRKFKPDVIICRFPTTGEGGHGHHTASAILALEAYDLSGDPTKFPEQLSLVNTWQAKRIFWNTYRFGRINTTTPDQLQIDVGAYNSLLGKSYGEIAAESRSMHKSQGFGSAKQRGSQIEYFKLLKGDDVKSDIFDGLSTNWNRLKNTEGITKQINMCIQNFNLLHPENSVKGLVKLYKLIDALPENDSYTAWWKHQKLDDLKSIIMDCAGLWIESTADDYIGIPGKPVNIETEVLMRNPSQVRLEKINYFNVSDTAASISLSWNKPFEFKRHVILPEDFLYSSPYWLKDPFTEGFYSVANQSLRGMPQNNVQTVVYYTLDIEGLKLTIAKDLSYKFTDPVKGELYRPFEVLPIVTLTPNENTVVLNGADSKSVFYLIKSNANDVSGELVLTAGAGCKIEIKNSKFHLINKGDEVLIEAIITVIDKSYSGQLNASVKIEGQTLTHGIKRIEYDHIPYRFVLNDNSVKLVKFDIQSKGKRIGYIPGAGDKVGSCLKQIGYTVDVLDDDFLKNGDLTLYDAIITGIRAFNTNEKLPLVHTKLMEYVQQGGRMLVQYNTNSRVGPIETNIGPYPFTISRNRVTDEHAEVRFVNPKHPLLNYPNAITQNDFEGWIQERGIYFATDMDSSYQTIFSINDPGEKPELGSLIYTNYGKGYFIYTGLAFFRELPAAVPGAYRLFVNLISQDTKTK
ncbi:MAG: PIG-L family deacetylase [Bacteroidia bacterium]